MIFIGARQLTIRLCNSHRRAKIDEWFKEQLESLLREILFSSS